MTAGGVGKSMTARAVARSVMKETDADTCVDWCGVTTINGHYYGSESSERVATDSLKIETKIAAQLLMCPRSVIIMEVRVCAYIARRWAECISS